MKKKIILFLFSSSILAFVVYKYVYQQHRDISSEKASYSISVDQLKNEFSQNESNANKKYLDKTIDIYGEVTAMDLANKQIVIDSSLTTTFSEAISNVKEKQKITVKGRFIGYNDLLEEFELDQCVIIK